MTVGRNDDFSALTSALADARAGAGSMVILAGDAGVGKTRIARDIARAAAERGMTTLAGGCAEAELSLPYLPFLEAIGNHLTTVDTADLRERLGPPARELARLFPQLRIEASPLDPSDPIQSKLRLFESIVAVLDLASREGGALLLIEDLHWADESTRELLDYLVRRIRVQRLLVVATCRTDEIDRRHPLATSIARWERGGVRLQRLGPLDPDQVGEMLAAIMGVPAIAADVMDFFHNRSEGNPFALEEILKEALDRGGLDPRAATRLDLTSAQARLPRTVRDTVTRRVERLAWGTGEVVRAGAVLGRSFHYHTLQQTSDQSEADVHEALRVCVDQQLMEEDPASPEKYRFRHALTQAAIYEELLAPERENLHRRAALVLRADPTANPIELLRHLLAARMWTEAVPLAIDASRQAMAAHAYRDAAGLLERILPFVTDPARGELMVQLGQALHLAGDAAGGERNLKDGVALMLAAGNRSGAASGRLWLGRCHWERARPDLAKAEYERARDDLQDGGPSEDLALSYVRLASLAVFDLDGQRAVDLAEHAIEIAELAGATAPRIWAYNFLGLGLVQLRRVDEGLASLEASYQDAAARGLNVIAANALYNDIQVRIQHLRPLEAVDRLRILESLQAGSMGSLQSLRAAGQVHLWGLGNPGQALSAFQSASTLAREGDAHYWEMWLRPHMAVALAQLDRLGEALTLLQTAGGASERQDRVLQAWATMRINFDAGNLPAAIEEAGRLATEEGLPLRVRLYLTDVAVEVLLADGRHDEADRLARLVADLDPDPDHPWWLRVRGRLATNPTEAASLLETSASTLRAAGARHEAATSALALADLLATNGSSEQALELVRAVAVDARKRGAALDERLARRRQTDWGTDVTTPERVREALENLHQPNELARSQLVNAIEATPFGEGPGPALHKLLVEVVNAIATSSDPRDAEAGKLLHAYYIKRVGSQEVVAERLHLTRATFYRRLHRGWQAVVERLANQ